MESGFMMKEHLIERGTFGLRFCWNVDPEEESQQMSRLAMIWSKNLVDVKIVGEWNCHFLWWWKSHQLHEIFRWSEYPATSRGVVSLLHPNHLPLFFPLWIFHSFLVLLLSLLAPSIANLARGCKGLWKVWDLSAIQFGRKKETIFTSDSDRVWQTSGWNIGQAWKVKWSMDDLIQEPYPQWRGFRKLFNMWHHIFYHIFLI